MYLHEYYLSNAWTAHDSKLPTDDIGELGKYKMDEILLHLQFNSLLLNTLCIEKTVTTQAVYRPIIENTPV